MAEAAIILSKTRQAIVAYLQAVGVGTDNIYNGKASAEKVSPCVGCSAKNAKEDPPNTGNYWVEVEVEIRTLAAINTGEAETDPFEASEAIATAVFNALEVDDLPEQLTAAIPDFEFTCIGVGEDKELSEDEDGDQWVEAIKLKLYCAPSAL